MAWLRLVGGTVLAGLVSCASAAPPAPKRAPEYPLNCAGIVVGMSTERDVRRMYGDGLFAKDEGHGGGWYYVDPGRKVTLHLEIGEGRYIESVSYSRGVRLPANSPRALARATTSRLTATEFCGVGVRLGVSPARLIAQLGQPRSDRRSGTTRELRFETNYERSPYVLDYEAEFRFTNDRLVYVRLYNGE